MPSSMLLPCTSWDKNPVLGKKKITREYLASYAYLQENKTKQAYKLSWKILTLIRPGGGGGGGEIHPPSTFRAIISRNFFPVHCAFATFFFQVLRNFWCYFRKNRAYRSEVTQHYVIERRLKIWEFSGFVYKTYGKWLFVLKIKFGL